MGHTHRCSRSDIRERFALPREELQPLLLRIVDLGVPRNDDPRVGALPGVALTHLDDLVVATPGTGAGSASQAEDIVREEANRFTKWHRERAVAPLVAALYQRHLAARGRGAREQNRLLHERICQIKASVAA